MVSGNWDLFKVTRRLPRVGPPGRGVTILLVSEPSWLYFFLDSFTVFSSSPVDIGSVLTILVTNVYLKCY